MIRALLGLAATLRIEIGKAMAGPCEHCEARNRRAVDLAAAEAARADDEAFAELAGLCVAEIEAYLLGVGEGS
jgi:hypothetical protein